MRALTDSSMALRAALAGSVRRWKMMPRISPGTRSTSPNENDAVTTPSVPPTTMSIAGTSMNAPAEPPNTMATATRPAAAPMPKRVAKSIASLVPHSLAGLARVPSADLVPARHDCLAYDWSCLMISVIVTPSRSSTTTTSPRATRRSLT